MTEQAMSPLRRRMIEDMTVRNFVAKTQSDYIRHIKNFAVFLGRSPDTAAREDVRRYLLHLASRGVSAATVNGAGSALRLSPLEAIREACLLRFRPIMMTTMAALLAGLPLMLSHGTGSELRQPLGYSMVGGLILSQALTLYTTPLVFLYLDRVNMWLQQLGRGTRSGATTPPAQSVVRIVNQIRTYW